MDRDSEREIMIFHKLIDLKFNIKSVGFDFWKMALFYYGDFGSIVELYKYIARRYGRSWSNVEKAMRTAIDIHTNNAIRNHYKYEGNQSNIEVLRLIANEIYSVKEV